MRTPGSVHVPAVIVAFSAIALAGCTTETGSDGQATGSAEAAYGEGAEAVQPTAAGGYCVGLTEDQRAVFQQYVDTWNSGDAEALAAMHLDTAGQTTCQYEAALATGVTLEADFGTCELVVTDDAGQVGIDTIDMRVLELGWTVSGAVIFWVPDLAQNLVGNYTGSDDAVLAFWDCTDCFWNPDLYSETQKAVIEDYVAAFNARDIDAVMALFAPEPNGFWPTEQAFRAENEALFRSGLELRVDLEHGTYEFIDSNGVTLEPGLNGHCILAYGPVFMFGEDGTADSLKGTTLGNEVLLLDSSRHFLDESTREALTEAYVW